MKKLFFALLGAAAIFTACSDDDPAPNPNPPGSSDTTLRGVITSNLTLTKNHTWILRGYVYVSNGATLTIEPGTRIISRKDSAGVLAITKGAKINAVGTANEPIVFTSGEAQPAPGDLGGVLLLGEATVNGNHQRAEGEFDHTELVGFGGQNDADNSGRMSYVRIEYGGKAANPNDEINGLSLYGVGSGTTIDHIQVTRGLDDAYEFFGGTVNCSYMIAYNSGDDDFDFDDGYRGTIQFGISIKDPNFTDSKAGGSDLSNNLEADNTDGSAGKPFDKTPITHPVLSNFTFVGINGAATPVTQFFGHGNRWRRGATFDIANSIIIGAQRSALELSSNNTVAAFTGGTSTFQYNLIHSVGANYALGSDVNNGTTVAQVEALAAGVLKYATAAEIGLTDPFNNATPNLKPAANSPALTGANFTGTGFANNAFVNKTITFRGAFGADDWTTGWTRWGL